MAEANEEDQPPSLPPRGRVESVRKQFSVHEDGALAYQIQNEEINQHYGLNRYHRKTVREDIPVAKIVQSEEELRQQGERMRELELLKVQAEKDEQVARQINEQLKREVSHSHSPPGAALDDEELARQMQEKEKKKYERHLEKKREKKLKQERQRLEADLARESENAGLHAKSDASSDCVPGSIDNLNMQGVNQRRVTPAGKIEDEGDFSDFYRLPDEMDEFTRLEIQASQDEELAKLLQEQEHKRSKAEVDAHKMKRIEKQDEELAIVMQEQEKIRLKKAKQKHQQKKEAQKLKTIESLPLGASANSLNTDQPPPRQPVAVVSASQHSPCASPSLPIAGATRYRRNSYTQAFDDPAPSPPRSQPPPRPSTNRNRQDQQQQQSYLPHHPQVNSSSSFSSVPPHSPSVNRRVQQQQYQQDQPLPPPHHLANRPPMPLPSHTITSGQGLSTLESARRIAAGDHNGILAVQQNTMPSPRMGTANAPGRDGPVDVIRSSGRGRGQNPRLAASQSLGLASTAANVHHSHQLSQHGDFRQPQQYQDDRGGGDMPEVHQWLDAQDQFGSGGQRGGGGGGLHPSQAQQQGWQRAISYSDDDDEFGPHHGSPQVNGSSGFNIATAIDPTYQKRYPEAAVYQPDETQLKQAIPFSRSLPQADGEVEWDPGLRGSLRKTKAPIHGYPDSSSATMLSGSSVDPSWQPVQGQRRGDTKTRKSSKQRTNPGPPIADGKKDKNSNCKQQ